MNVESVEHYSCKNKELSIDIEAHGLGGIYQTICTVKSEE